MFNLYKLVSDYLSLTLLPPHRYQILSAIWHFLRDKIIQVQDKAKVRFFFSLTRFSSCGIERTLLNRSMSLKVKKDTDQNQKRECRHTAHHSSRIGIKHIKDDPYETTIRIKSFHLFDCCQSTDQFSWLRKKPSIFYQVFEHIFLVFAKKSMKS